MTPPAIRRAHPSEGARFVAIWAAAVDATHDFLTPADRLAIGQEGEAFLPSAPAWVAVDGNDVPLGFMLLDGGHMDALFIDPASRGRGVGRALVGHALAQQGALTTDVNEQNHQAVGFYRHMGFAPTGRSACDDQGRPYPLIHLRHPG